MALLRRSEGQWSMRKWLLGSVIGVATAVVLAAAMLPFRSQLATATAAVVLVVPCVAGVVSGGLVAGLVSVATGFLVYDFVFVSPYGTLTVSNWQDWVALGVYVLVTGARRRDCHQPGQCAQRLPRSRGKCPPLAGPV